VTDLYSAAARWQWAFDAAAAALEANRDTLPAVMLAEHAHELASQRTAAARLLRDVAALTGVKPVPWFAGGVLTPRMLGLPQSTQACLFDLDGVLTNSDALHAEAWAAALEPVLLAAASEERLHYAPFDRVADYHAYFDGRPRLEGIQLFLSGRGLRLPPATLDELARRKGEVLDHGLRARGIAGLPGAERYLHGAALARLGRVVVSASLTAAPMLERAGLARLVDARVDADTLRAGGLRSRPAPDLLVAACDAIGVEPSQAVSLTHSGAGVVAARGLGMTVIGVAVGADAETLRDYGAEIVVPSLAALLDPSLRER
jgi:beta-phosphoglucomutase-like phosphatase (HAD superfamily)